MVIPPEKSQTATPQSTGWTGLGAIARKAFPDKPAGTTYALAPALTSVREPSVMLRELRAPDRRSAAVPVKSVSANWPSGSDNLKSGSANRPSDVSKSPSDAETLPGVF
jgi:hypothetical protein